MDEFISASFNIGSLWLNEEVKRFASSYKQLPKYFLVHYATTKTGCFVFIWSSFIHWTNHGLFFSIWVFFSKQSWLKKVLRFQRWDSNCRSEELVATALPTELPPTLPNQFYGQRFKVSQNHNNDATTPMPMVKALLLVVLVTLIVSSRPNL